MRHLRSFAALLTIAAITVACGASPGSGGQSQGAEPSTGSQPSQAAASSGGGGGGGGGGGANGSITYQITGDYTASGELAFLTSGVSTWVEQAGGWVASFGNLDGTGAYVLLNTQAADGTSGQVFTYGDGSIIVVAGGGEMGCTFNLTKNDSSGLSGDVTCTSAIGADANSGVQKHVQIHAEWDAHP